MWLCFLWLAFREPVQSASKVKCKHLTISALCGCTQQKTLNTHQHASNTEQGTLPVQESMPTGNAHSSNSNARLFSNALTLVHEHHYNGSICDVSINLY